MSSSVDVFMPGTPQGCFCLGSQLCDTPRGVAVDGFARLTIPFWRVLDITIRGLKYVKMILIHQFFVLFKGNM